MSPAASQPNKRERYMTVISTNREISNELCSAGAPPLRKSTKKRPASSSREAPPNHKRRCLTEDLLRISSARRDKSSPAMGNCVPRKIVKSTSPPPLAAEVPEVSAEESSSPAQESATSSPKAPATVSAAKYGTRRRLSLIHAEPITHASDEGPRGTAKVFQRKPGSLESKLSLEGMLAHNGGGTRVSVMGAAALRAQSNFENKNETLRGNGRVGALADLGIGHACKKGLKPESPNQDDFFIYHVEDIGLYGVFDGHGPYGHDISNFVQQNLPKYLYNHAQFEADPLEAIRASFHKIQAEIEKCCERREFDASLSGCTATVIVHNMLEQKLYVGHVGDSRAVLARRSPTENSYTAVDLTEDHKPTLDRERERIEAHGGEVKRLEGDIPHRVFLKGKLYPGLAMSRALGDLVAGSAGVSAEPDVSEWQLDPAVDTFLVLCSDGVWEFISSQQAVQMVAKNSETEVQIAADALARESWNKWIDVEEDVVDDITVEVIYLFPRQQDTSQE